MPWVTCTSQIAMEQIQAEAVPGMHIKHMLEELMNSMTDREVDFRTLQLTVEPGTEFWEDRLLFNVKAFKPEGPK